MHTNYTLHTWFKQNSCIVIISSANKYRKHYTPHPHSHRLYIVSVSCHYAWVRTDSMLTCT